MYLFGLIPGSVILVLIFHDAFEVMLLPRRVRRKLRFITLLFRYTWNLWSWVAERMALGIRRDTFLSLYGPLSLVMLIGSWVIGLVAGFALIQDSLAFGFKPVGFGANLLLSGDTFFTLGTASIASMQRCEGQLPCSRRAAVWDFWRSSLVTCRFFTNCSPDAKATLLCSTREPGPHRVQLLCFLAMAIAPKL